MDDALIGRGEELARLERVLGDATRASVVVGDAGVGKSRLLRAAADRAAAGGWTVFHIRGTASGRDIALGAVSHLLPSDADDDAATFGALRTLLSPGTPREQLLVAVDDAHDLDEASGALLHQVLSHGDARLVLMTRDDTQGPRSLRSLWREDDIDRIDLDPLDREETEDLVAALLGGPAATSLLGTLWDLSQGHPLYVRVALDAARDRGDLEFVDGRWSSPGGIRTDRLRDLVLARLRGLSTAALRSLQLVSTATSLTESALRIGVPDHDVDSLADRGLVRTTVTVQGHRVVEVGHPLYSDIVLGMLTPREQSELRLDAAAALLANADRSDDDVLRATLWTIDEDPSTLPADALDAVAIATRRGDWSVVERIARRVLEATPGSVPAVLALGRALSFQGRARAAEETLASSNTDDEPDAVELTLLRAHNLAFGLGQIAQAVDLLGRAAARVGTEDRWRLQADRSLYSAIVGDFSETISASTATLDDPHTPRAARGAATVNLVLARAMTGRLDGFDSTVENGLRLADELSEALPLAREQISVAAAAGWVIAGRIEDARDRCLADLAAAGATETGGPMSATWLAIVRALEGRFIDADAWIERALADYGRDDPFRLGSQAMGIAVLHRAQTGRLRAGDPADLQRAADDAGDETRLRIWVDRAAAWMRSVTEPDVSETAAVEAANRAIERDHVGWGAMALHDVVRRGHPGPAVSGLDVATTATDGALLVHTMREHAIAALEGDPDGLDVVGRRFTSMGALLLGAEAHGEAAQVRHREGDESGGRRSAFLASRLLPPDDGVTPMLRNLPPSLSDRESEISERAATGARSRDIAEDLFLSVRTVDNHLRTVYRKLGMSGRPELQSFLRPDFE